MSVHSMCAFLWGQVHAVLHSSLYEMLFGSLQCVVSYQCEVLEGIAFAIIQDSPEPHAKQLHCYSCEGCYSVVCLQHKL